jgi:hypothetical protein
VQAREVHELVAHPHLGVEAALLGHVAKPGPRRGVHGPVAPGDRAAVRLQHAEHDAHGGGLAGAVRTHEAEHLPRRDREGDAVQGGDLTEAARQAGEHEHRASVIRARRGDRAVVHTGSAHEDTDPSLVQTSSRANIRGVGALL